MLTACSVKDSLTCTLTEKIVLYGGVSTVGRSGVLAPPSSMAKRSIHSNKTVKYSIKAVNYSIKAVCALPTLWVWIHHWCSTNLKYLNVSYYEFIVTGFNKKLDAFTCMHIPIRVLVVSISITAGFVASSPLSTEICYTLLCV